MTDLIVSVEQGELLGRICVDYKGGKYYSFQGIPYAKPPLGELRFKAPQPPEKWAGIRDATQEGNPCFSRHMVFQNFIGSEDCLILNVYTPELPKPKVDLKPVMVWIHGGAFTSGSSKTEMYGPDFLIAEDVVVVTINYRLGVLGFLSFDDPAVGVPGNAACKDMVMALKWVQKNVRNFNGDPDNVTIFGESAGAGAVHLLMLSPMSQGLFHKAIAQSGCALNPWSIGRSCVSELTEVLGCTCTNGGEILAFLQSLPVEKIFGGQELLKDPFKACVVRPIGPVIERPSQDEPAFLSEQPLDIILQGKYYKVPLIIGYTSREGMFFEVVEKRRNVSQVVRDFEDVVPSFLGLQRGSSVSKATAKKIKEFYYGDEEPSDENKDKLYLMQTDVHFFRGIYSSAKNHAATSSSSVYLYRFSVEGSLNVYKVLGNIQSPGASHADDLGYLFKMVVTPDDIASDSVEGKAIARMTRLWANFARNGNPNSPLNDPLLDVSWKSIEGEAVHFLDIGHELKSDVNPEAERMAFWDEIFSSNPAMSKL